MLRAFSVSLGLAWWGALGAVHGQAPIDPVADLFEARPPLPAGVREQPVGPLRLPDAAVEGANGVVRLSPQRASPPRRPPFSLHSGDRVLFLGDGVFEAEARHGYLETRLQTEGPTNRLVIRNLSASIHNRLRDADPGPASRDLRWLTNLLEEVRAVRPDVVFLSYGTAPALRGMEQLATFSNVYARAIQGVVDASNQPDFRVVVCSPLSYEPKRGETLADVTNRNQVLLQFADTAWQISTNHKAEFVDFHLFSRNDILSALRQGEEGGATRPGFTVDQATPTAFGLRRLAFALERGLRWTSSNWRFGLMADGQWRDGGFGAAIASSQRTDSYVRVGFTEEQLPLPNPVEPIDLAAEVQPQCYIQVRSLKSGMYDLRVDGKSVLSGSHQDWHRYEIITRGPSWDQAERLRQAIVEKNELWGRVRKAAGGTPSEAVSAADAAVLELETGIASLKRPVPRVYELVRTGDAPAEPAGPLAP